MALFSNKTVVVTGGANGIGRVIVSLFAETGANVVIADIDHDRGNKLNDYLHTKGYNSLFVPCNVRIEEDIKKLFTSTLKAFRSVDILVNNAGVSKFQSLFDLTVEEWEEVMDTNLKSVFLCSREAAKEMKPGSSIVNIASTRAFMSEENTEAYSASKGGVVAITHALARTLSKKGITVNCISPGWIETEDYNALRPIDHTQHLSNRVGKPEDVARCCLFLCKSENNFINGENIILDGGMTKKMIYEH